ncbi:TetR/AcrR family transcriptional regulator [Aliiglaciecola sp. CAU 1673]|uniref:TetR/AcrR family transcriptional regulator n=1 Tax=Aliiglaciecola sp. CAU 1673 TaxID=3032595 RepID=UPI0023DCC1EE|nr:TetR/AcrR family transcriptional regulator [Aliiglaciecola sp. CAU 1673]MDF2180006.1 TetR/AcrR family transcriptional regulator [Aliiglaciecola sp. CAU 1673]
MSAETKTQILDAAEVLFSEHGFGDTSLRAITSQAKVNLASVNYHFGSKKQLIQEVLQRYLRVLMPSVDQQVKQLLAKHPQPSVEQVFASLIQPLLLLNQVRPQGTAIFVRLLGRGYSESQGHLRKYITVHYGDMLKRFVSAVHLAVPQLSDAEIFWRLHFAIGTFVFTMASSKALSEIAEADYQEPVAVADIIQKLIPYISAGVGAPAAQYSFGLNPVKDIA